jgi:peptidyl-tRNA hydrolase, PTH2 family
MEDPIVMYLVVRESLNMSIGKTAAQCAHAAGLLQYQADVLRGVCGSLGDYDLEGVRDTDLFIDWMDSSYTKVVLGADEKEWAKLKEQINPANSVIVVDCGKTELVPNTETVAGLWPCRKSQAPKIIKKLQVLK